MAAAFFFLYRAYDEGGMLNWVMAGIVAGVAQYFYAGARFVTIMVGVTTVYFLVRERWPFVRTHWRGLIAVVVAFIISAGRCCNLPFEIPTNITAGSTRWASSRMAGWKRPRTSGIKARSRS